MSAEAIPKDIIEAHLPLVKFVAQRLARRLPASISLDDLIQWGSIGLIDCLKRFDPTRGNKFKTYAEFRIRGAMLDGLRDSDIIPRSTRDMEKMLEVEINKFKGEHTRAPASHELAERLGMSVSELQKLRFRIQPITQISAESLEVFDHRDRKALLASIQNNSKDVVQKIYAMQKLEKLVHNHEPTNRACFILYYVWGFSMAEIGELFNCSESRISQRIRKVHDGRFHAGRNL